MFPTTLANAVYRRQALLIDALKTMEGDKILSDRKRDVEKLRTLLGIYSDFAKLFDEGSLCYGIPTMFVAGVIFVQALVAIFAIYKQIILTGSLTASILSLCLYSFYYGVQFNACLTVCTITRMQVR